LLVNLQASIRQILIGDILFIVCCGFYLAWWLVAFRINDPIKGIRSGWLLIPAAIAGVAAVVLIIQGMNATKPEHTLFPGIAFVVGGIIAYVVLAVVTVLAFKRPMTSELLLFVGWGALTLAQVNTLHGAGQLAASLSWILVAVIILFVAASLVCYVLFYRLPPQPAFIDGMIPLILVALSMAGLSVCIVV